MTASVPTIDNAVPPSVYTALPDILQRACSLYSGDRAAQAAFLHGALPVFSRVLPNSKIVLRDKDHRLSLFVYVYGKAGAGKGAAGDALQLIQHLTDREQRKNQDNEREHIEAVARAKKEDTTMPEPPTMVDMHLPLRTTPSTLLRRLRRNPQSAVPLLADTEGHALGNPSHKDHGSIRQLMLKGFEGERDGQLWKETGLEMLQCWLSMLITSTPQQLLDGIGTTEDGLFSRFIWHGMPPGGGRYRDPRPTAKTSRATRLLAMGPEVTRIYDKMHAAAGDVQVLFTSEQYDAHAINMQSIMDAACDRSTDLEGAIGRLGNMVLRTAALLTLLRAAEQPDRESMPASIDCDELSWSAAMQLSGVWLDSMLDVYGMFTPGAAEPENMNQPQRAAQFIRDYLVQHPQLKPKAALQKLRAENDAGVLHWLNTLSNQYDRVRHLLNAERERLSNA